MLSFGEPFPQPFGSSRNAPLTQSTGVQQL
jgi:hypothetical protein